MESPVKPWMHQIAVLIEVSAAIIIVLAVVRVILSLVKSAFGEAPDLLDIRVSLGKWLVLALEFALAADIILTTISPSWTEIGKLAAIAALRTFLNYFLHKEIDAAAELRDQGRLETG